MVLAVLAVAAAVGQAGLQQHKYVFVENTTRRVGVWRGEWILIGALDATGEFHPKTRESAFSGLSAGSLIYSLLSRPHVTPMVVYEFRSGSLVRGAIGLEGVFVPEPGGTVIRLTDYKPGADTPPIWNLPGWFKLAREQGTGPNDQE